MKTKWLMLLATILLAVTAEQGAADETLPDAGAVVEKYVEAIGGRAVIAAHKSAAIAGTFAMEAAGVSGDFKQFTSSEHGYRMQLEIPGMGTFGEGYKDGVAWGLDPMQGPRILDGDAALALRHRSVFPAELNYDTMYQSMAVEGIVEFDGKRCYRVALDPGWGDPRYEYFEVESGLMAGAEAHEPGPDGGTMAITTVLGDYREFGGQLVPARSEQKTPMGVQVVTMTSVEFNTLDVSQLDPPPAVKALLESED